MDLIKDYLGVVKELIRVTRVIRIIRVIRVIRIIKYLVLSLIKGCHMR